MRGSVIAVAAILAGTLGHTKDPVNGALRSELLEMGRRDQEVRERWAPLALGGTQSYELSQEALAVLTEMQQVDQANFQRLDQIITQHGWPSVDLVGKDAADVARLLVQHADLERQKRYLPMVRAAAKVGDVSAADMARLEDRVRIREGKKQLLGSNFERGPDGACVITPIEDASNVDARRREVGLPPLQVYIDQLAQQTGIQCRLADEAPQ